MLIRPIVVAGIALASTGAPVAGTPAALPAPTKLLAASASVEAPAKRTVTVAQLRLLAALEAKPLSELTIDDIAAAFNGEYGPYVGEDDPYYPTEEPTAPSGFVGLSYFLTDSTLYTLIDSELPLVSDAAQFAYDNVTSYYYEIGGLAALHVALAEAAGGPDTPLAQLLQRIFNPDAIESVNTMRALAGLAPKPLSDVTLEDIVAAYEGEYGPWVGEDDAYYPTDEPTTPDGLVGVGYFLTDATLQSITDANLPVVSDISNFAFENVTSYYYEVDATAALHVALAEATGGPDTPFAQLLQRIFNPDAAGSSLTQTSGIEARGLAEPLEVNEPDELPTPKPTLVGADAEPTVEESDDDAPEPVTEKKKPKFNVKKENPLAQLSKRADEAKTNADNTFKAFSKAVQQLTGGAQDTKAEPEAPKADDDKPSDPKPADSKPSDNED